MDSYRTLFERELKVVEGALVVSRTTMGRESNARQRFINMWLDTDEAKKIGEDPITRHDFASIAGLTAGEFIDWGRRISCTYFEVGASKRKLQELEDSIRLTETRFSYSNVRKLEKQNTELKKKAKSLDEIIEKLVAQEIELAGWDDENNTILYCTGWFVVENNDGVVHTTDSFKGALKSFFERVKE